MPSKDLSGRGEAVEEKVKEVTNPRWTCTSVFSALLFIQGVLDGDARWSGAGDIVGNSGEKNMAVCGRLKAFPDIKSVTVRTHLSTPAPWSFS